MGRPAAIFDLDGTLIPNTSAERAFFSYLVRRGILSPWNIVQMAASAWSAGLNLHAMTRGNKIYLRGKSIGGLRTIARDFFEPRIQSMVFPTMQSRIERHRDAGDLLLLLTGSLDVIAECFVRHLNLDGQQSAHLQVRNGRCTGRVEGILPYGLGKLEVLRMLRQRFDVDQGSSWLYANVYSDRFVMNAVEHPVAVNPDRRLRAYALRHHWMTVQAQRR